MLSSETGLTVTEGYAAGSSYTVKLATQPTGERHRDRLRDMQVRT